MEQFWTLITGPAFLDGLTLICLVTMPFMGLANLIHYGKGTEHRWKSAFMSLMLIAVTAPMLMDGGALGLTFNPEHRRLFPAAALLLLGSTAPIFGELLGAWWFSRMLKRIGRSVRDSKDRQ